MPNQYDNASGARPQGRTRKDSVIVTVRLTRDEHRRLIAEAKRYGMSKGEYLRRYGVPYKPGEPFRRPSARGGRGRTI